MNQPPPNQILGDATIYSPAVVRPSVRVGPRVDQDQETKITLNKNGTTVESIHITCACGEEIVVKCAYTEKDQ